MSVQPLEDAKTVSWNEVDRAILPMRGPLSPELGIVKFGSSAMQYPKRSLYLWLLAVCVAGVLVWLTFPRAAVEQIQYKSYRGEHPTIVEIKFSPPSQDLTSVAETTVSTEFRPGELISLHGSLEMTEEQRSSALVVRFVEHTKKGDVTANSTSFAPDADSPLVEIMINAPKQPGKYSLIVVSGDARNYIARSEITVRNK